MCLIVDNDVIALVLFHEESDYKLLFRAINKLSTNKRLFLVYGGELRRQYRGSERIINRLNQLGAAGRAKIYPDSEVDMATSTVRARGVCISNDEHIIGLALVTEARILCTNDGNLKRDFQNRVLLPDRRGKIWSASAHKHLLRQLNS